MNGAQAHLDPLPSARPACPLRRMRTHRAGNGAHVGRRPMVELAWASSSSSSCGRHRPAVNPMDPWANNYRVGRGVSRVSSGPSVAASARHHLLRPGCVQPAYPRHAADVCWLCLTAILIGFIGTNIGLISGYFGGVVDEVLMRITDFFYAIPFLPFMMVVVALIDRSLPVDHRLDGLHILAHRRARHPRAGFDTQDAALCARRAGERGRPPTHHVCAYPAERAAARLPLSHLRRGVGESSPNPV